MKVLKERRQLIDGKTGEVIEVLSIIPEVKDRNFVKVFKLMSRKVIQDLKAGLNGATDTLWWIIDHLKYDVNEVFAHPQDIARDLGINVRTAKRHLKILKDLGYIHQVKPKHHVYRIDPYLLFKGRIYRVFSEGDT